MAFQLELLEHRFGDVVVAPPVGGPLRVGELVHVVAAALGGEARRLRVERPRVVDEVAAPAVEFDEAGTSRGWWCAA